MESTAPQSGAPVKVVPQKEHEWLHRLVGEWSFEIEASAETGQPAEKGRGTESVRSLGGLWVQAEGHGTMPDGDEATTVMTLGYDPSAKRYVGTWIGSMMTYLWVYDGELDPSGRVLTLNAEGPDMSTEGKMAKYRDVIEFKSDDHRVLTSHFLTDAGTWNHFMTAHYRRKR